MTARQQIAQLLRRWREISQAQFLAIHSGDWPKMRDLQAAKTGVQNELTEARRLWNEGHQPSPAPADAFAAETDELLALETRNAQFLLSRRQRLLDRQNLLRKARTNIRRLRGSYAGASGGKWQSYS